MLGALKKTFPVFILIVFESIIFLYFFKSYETKDRSTFNIKSNEEFEIKIYCHRQFCWINYNENSKIKCIKRTYSKTIQDIFYELIGDRCIGCGQYEHWVFQGVKPGKDTIVLSSCLVPYNPLFNKYPYTFYVSIK